LRFGCGLACELPHGLDSRRSDMAANLAQLDGQSVEGVLGRIDLAQGAGLHGGEFPHPRKFLESRFRDEAPLARGAKLLWRLKGFSLNLRRRGPARSLTHLAQAQEQSKRREAGDDYEPAYQLRTDVLHVEPHPFRKESVSQHLCWTLKVTKYLMNGAYAWRVLTAVHK
jgi:hypothetical protein